MIAKFLVTAKVNWSWNMKGEQILLVDKKIIVLLNGETFFVTPMS